MSTQNLRGMDFCRQNVYGVQLDLPGTWDWDIKNPPKSFCHGSFHHNKPYPHLSQTLTTRTPYTMCIDAMSSWKFLPTNTHIYFPLDSTFQPNWKAVTTGLTFMNTLCTRSERNLPILMENDKNHQITITKGRIGFSFLKWLIKMDPKPKNEFLTN